MIIDWVNDIQEEPSVFVIITSYHSIEIIHEGKQKHLGFFATRKWLSTFSFKNAYYHYLAPQMVLLSAPLNIKRRVWILWGGDFYDLPGIRKTYLHTDSKLYRSKTLIRDYIATSRVIPFIKNLTAIASNIEDFEEVKKAFPSVSVQHLPLHALFPIHHYYEEIPIAGNALLIGNSDDIYNNHLMALDRIKNYSLSTPALLPISGVSSKYTQALKKYIHQSNLSIQVLDDFVDKEDFFTRLQSVSHVLFPHFRQQGLGTLLPLLYSGRTLFLHEKNPLSRLLRQWGIHFYFIHEMTEVKLSEGFSEEIKAKNKLALERALGKSVILSQWHKILA